MWKPNKWEASADFEVQQAVPIDDTKRLKQNEIREKKLAEAARSKKKEKPVEEIRKAQPASPESSKKSESVPKNPTPVKENEIKAPAAPVQPTSLKQEVNSLRDIRWTTEKPYDRDASLGAQKKEVDV